MYYKVLNDEMQSCVVEKSKSIQYIKGEWVNAPAINQPLFVFRDFESAKSFRDKNVKDYPIYECEVDGIVNFHETKNTYTCPNGTVFACKVKIVEKVQEKPSEIKINVGDVLSCRDTTYIVTCEWVGSGINRHSSKRIVILSTGTNTTVGTVGEELSFKVRDFNTLEDIMRKAGYSFKLVGKFNDIFKKT